MPTTKILKFERQFRRSTRTSMKGSPLPLTTWNHINPNGGRNQGCEATLTKVREVHQTFLKGDKESIESMDVRFAADDVAVGTVISVSAPFVSPDGTNHDVQRGIRTFVIVKRGGRWLIMQDRKTTIVPPPR
jgi:uncharacterized protein (TIGR02246 family)